MGTLDPTKMADWQIAEAAEKTMKPIAALASSAGLLEEEVFPYGHYMGKIDSKAVMQRRSNAPNGKYINVTAITPTPLGEGKSTTTIGLIQGLGKLGKRVIGAIRQPSSGPTFNIKGSAAGGGRSQCIPLSDFSLGLTGDIDAITNAHNLGMVALTSRMHHEAINTDEFLLKRNLKRLNIDPHRVTVGWAMDFCAQALRHIVIGLGGEKNGVTMESHFQITVSSELMAILAVAKDLPDFRARVGAMVLAYSRNGSPVTARDLEVDGAMCALMAKALHPTMIQTLEGQPVFAHAGPFANIAIGQSSIIADYLGLNLADYHVTESGFGADIGFEKFIHLKCRMSGLSPSAAVLVATIRALKMHGGGPTVTPGKPLDKAYTEKNPALVEKGIENLIAHIETITRMGVPPVVCLNHFYTDDDDEIALVKKAAENAGARFAVSKHWEKGGEGAQALAEAVIDAANEPSSVKFLYDENASFQERIETIAKNVYGAREVTYTSEAAKKIAQIEANDAYRSFGVCMVKTQYSLSADAALKGRPKDFALPIRDVLTYQGAEFVVPVAGDIMLMPGAASDAAYRRIDIDAETGRVKGLF